MYVGRFLAVLFVFGSLLAAQQTASSASGPSSPPAALTIYNEDFAVVRTAIDLKLHPGLNEVSTNDVTSQLEPDSVVLRDPAPGSAAKPSFHISEQNYDAAVVTQDWLLQKYEGKTINFQVSGYSSPDGHTVTASTVPGKIIRAPQSPTVNEYGGYVQNQPLIEVNGQMQFQLPGTPLFPASTDGLLLKPTLRWQIDSEKAQNLRAELAYISSGFKWEATYNVVTGAAAAKPASTSASTEEKADLDGWVTLTNHSGADFPEARIKLMAGDVAKIQPQRYESRGRVSMAMSQTVSVSGEVTQKPFDDFHLYDLNRTVSLANGETKQIQFLSTPGITMLRSYIYDGSAQDRQPWSNYGNIVTQQNYGLNSSSTKVQIVEEIKNTQANRLGIPLPAGRIRLYRRDADGQMEFVGESTISHTPAEDTIKVNSGSAFDIKGARRQTNFSIDNGRRMLDEEFEIKLTNQKDAPVTVSVLEHLYRGNNWEIQKNSSAYTKLDSSTISFPVPVPAKGESTVTYTVHYTW